MGKGWIRPSCLPHGAPIILVRKKTGELRMTVDYRALNHQTKKDVYPLPRIDDLLDKLAKAKYLSAIDLASGYHQIAMAPEDIEKTAFVTRYGLYEYTVLPLGLCNAPSTFQRLMSEVMKGYIDDFVGVYLDDILVYTDGDAKDHERDLQKVFDRLQKHNLHAKLKKCDFGKDRVKYLGHVVDSGELRVDEDKVVAVAAWEAPSDIKGVQ